VVASRGYYSIVVVFLDNNDKEFFMLDNFEIVPMTNYSAPKYPTHEDALLDPALLKKIPSRWRKNIGAIACMGLLGITTTLSGCFGFGFRNCLNRPICSECGSSHWGGAGGPPIYIVYLTEQEAIDVMKNKAEYMGLNMSDTPPDYTVTFGQGNDSEVRLKLFNEYKNLAFSHVGARNNWSWQDFGEIARDVQNEFDAKDNDILTKVFYTDLRLTCLWTEQDHARIREELKQHLTAQVREFIEFLQAEGIIQ